MSTVEQLVQEDFQEKMAQQVQEKQNFMQRTQSIDELVAEDVKELHANNGERKHQSSSENAKELDELLKEEKQEQEAKQAIHQNKHSTLDELEEELKAEKLQEATSRKTVEELDMEDIAKKRMSLK